jgi:hypothetical protein
MEVRFDRAMVACIAGIGLLTGCIFDSRKPHESLRYVELGDGTGAPMEMDFTPTPANTGLMLMWTNTSTGSVNANRVEYTYLDSMGFNASSDLNYNDSSNLASPRISPLRTRGYIAVWIRNIPGETANEVAVDITDGNSTSPEPQHPGFGELRTARRVTSLTLPDDGYLLGVEGVDTSGMERLWVQRFDPKGKPEGEPWLSGGVPAPGALELVLLPDGGWTVMWTQSGTNGSRVNWQRFDPDGKPAGDPRTRLLSTGSSDMTLRAEHLAAGRILVQARSGKFPPFIIGADGEAETGWPDAGGWEGGMLAADTLRQLVYGLRDGKLFRLDSAFRVQATRELPSLLEWPPALALMPRGKIALIGHGDAGRSAEERRSFLVHTIDPF